MENILKWNAFRNQSTIGVLRSSGSEERVSPHCFALVVAWERGEICGAIIHMRTTAYIDSKHETLRVRMLC